MTKEPLPQNARSQDFRGFYRYMNSTILLGFIIILGLILRFYGLGTESYWIDEVATTIEARQSIIQLLTVGRLDQPPAYYLPMHFWLRAFGDSEASLRSFSAIAGLGSIILIYLIGKRLFGKEVGLLSAFFLALSDFQIILSQEARNYSLFEFAILLSFLFLIDFIQTKQTFRLVLYALASIFMVNSNAYGVFVIVGQNLFFLLQVATFKKIFTKWVVCQFFILLGVMPYLAPLLFGIGGVEGEISTNVTGVPAPAYLDILRSIYRFLLPPRRYFGTDMKWSDALFVIYLVAATFFVAGIFIYILKQGKSNWTSATKNWLSSLSETPDIKSKSLLLACWFLCPIILPFIISRLILPVYSHKYVIGAAPALYLLLSLGLFSIRKIIPMVISLGAFMLLAIPGLIYYYTSDTKEQWRETADYVAKNASKSDVILFAPNDNIGIQREAFDYYYEGELSRCGIGPDTLSDTEVWKNLKLCTSGQDSFWVIIRSSTTTENRYQSFFFDPGQPTLQMISKKQFIGIDVYQFELKK